MLENTNANRLFCFLSLFSFYLRREIGGEWCGFMCCVAAATLWCYLVLSWFKFYCCRALIHHSSAAHKSIFWHWFLWFFDCFFCLKAYAENWFLCALVSCWSTCFVYAQILFCRIYQVQKQQNKQARDMSSLNKGRLLNKML